MVLQNLLLTKQMVELLSLDKVVMVVVAVLDKGALLFDNREHTAELDDSQVIFPSISNIWIESESGYLSPHYERLAHVFVSPTGP